MELGGFFPTVQAVNQEEQKKTRLLHEATMMDFNSDLHDASLKGRRSALTRRLRHVGTLKVPPVGPGIAELGNKMELIFIF